MDKKQIIFLISLLNYIISFGQFTKKEKKSNGEELFIKNCIICHNSTSKAYAPFSLDSYRELYLNKKTIDYVVRNNIMPPWKSDIKFSRFKNEIFLTQEEKNIFLEWLSKLNKKSKIKIYKNKLFDKKNDNKNVVQLGIKNIYKILDNDADDFRYFHLKFSNKNKKVLKKVEFIPSNNKLVHHARVMVDTCNCTNGINALSANDTNIFKFQNKPLSDPFLFGWLPGNNFLEFPINTGKVIRENSDFILNIHYSPSLTVQFDSSIIKLTFTEDTNIREVFNFTFNEDYIKNGPFLIKSNDTPTFYMQTDPIEDSISIINILPHMHLIGKSFKSFAISPDDSIIKLINIENWDFNWQLTYNYKKFVVIPKGSRIYAIAKYDNTINNPNNEFNPPKDILYGWRTIDEMMNLIIYYVKYQKGDEIIDL